ncbi:hypothetical protein [Nostoc sp. CHAB 5715]|uniref:hypothetical protein n=1 Tax=Nostoc sp. CHAB 5715 TaxID=2780400 RepID=UPI001E2BA9AA|nr:hypothetical protein [Nostoc sp. CHAB 5715]MCC5622037.1 hypothetical protein [Nostoc sp. CHAB 5715]
MIGLDTNILVRYLTKDDEKQWKQAAEIIEREEQCFGVHPSFYFALENNCHCVRAASRREEERRSNLMDSF